jgi:quinolinate synthase
MMATSKRLILLHPISHTKLAADTDIEFVRPCALCPHMKRITLKNIRRALETLEGEVTIDPVIAVPARRAVERMLAL